MDTVGKLIAAVLLCSVICLLLKKQAPELTLCLCMLLCVLCFLTSLPFFSPVLAFFHRLADMTGLSGAVFAPLFKTAAIGILAQLAGTICRDSGQQALAQAGIRLYGGVKGEADAAVEEAVEICCGFVSFYLALPLLELVLSLLQTMIGG